MRYIVLYVLTALVIFALDATGQKPFIDLLPSDHGNHNRYRVADTSLTVSPVTDIPSPVPGHPARMDSCRITGISYPENENGPVKQPVQLFRLIFPNKIMILDLTAFKR